MRRGLVHVFAWTLATSAATTLSWWGVHTVLAGTVYDPPRALPIPTGGANGATPRQSEPPVSATSRSPTPTRAPSPAPARSTSPAPSPTPTLAPSPTPATSGDVKSYDTGGGRAVFDLGPVSATLVSATPAASWSMQVWKTASWIRVEFTSGADRVTVFCTWHDGPPRVEVITY
ncbi:hypothetical protein [Streptomyces sp. NPDC087212]|uniref:hypothetical protein n=1 Tax=Streptomyces sp. NPDC087212 TaxID=3365766 RepID=UPI00381DFA59